MGDDPVSVAPYDGAGVARIDPMTNAVAGEPSAIDSQPIALAIGEDSVWVVTETGAVARIGPESGAPVRERLSVGGRAHHVAFGEDSTVVRIEP